MQAESEFTLVEEGLLPDNVNPQAYFANTGHLVNIVGLHQVANEFKGKNTYCLISQEFGVLFGI